MKCVIVLDEALPVGLLANTAAVLGLSLGNHVAELIGPDIIDSDGLMHKGITAVPIPILAADRDTLKSLYVTAMEEGKELQVIGFNTTAQQCHHYELYSQTMMQKSVDELDYLGVCIYGPKKIINRLCGQLKLLR